MKTVTLRPVKGFHVLAQSGRSQAASMVLAAGESTGGSDNEHPGSDQWLYVLSGEGEAVVGGERVPLEVGTLLLIEAGETHEIRNVGGRPLETLNVYAPPAY